MSKQPLKRNFMDVLDDVDDDNESSSSSDSDDERPPTKRRTAPAKQSVRIEDLEKAGYSSGPSVLHIPASGREEPSSSWAWTDGTAAKLRETDDTAEERIETRRAVTSTLDDSALHALKALAHAEKLRAEKKAEKEAKLKSKMLSFKEKEKRKRDAGQQAAGKNYVEEEKRIAREAGIYSGFDT